MEPGFAITTKQRGNFIHPWSFVSIDIWYMNFVLFEYLLVILLDIPTS